VLQEAGNRSDRTGWTFGAASASSPITATRRQDVANVHQQNVTNLGFVAFCSRKAGHDARSFREASSSPTRRQEAANEHQQNVTNLGFVRFCPRKAGQEARSFREA